jgi:prepilin-type N-terminal cleavage/methylation domain-containing protein
MGEQSTQKLIGKASPGVFKDFNNGFSSLYIRMMSQKNQAFTLLELAITLTIIALLAGSTMLGQSMIRNSELQSVVNDVDRYKKAAQLFKDKYLYLPGDMPTASNFWTGAANGNGDGFIGDSTASALGNTTHGLEGFGVWQHLADAGFIEGAYSGTWSGSMTQEAAGVNTPASKVPGGTYLLFYVAPTTGSAGIFPANYRHVIAYGIRSTAANGTGPIAPYYPVLTAAEAMEIDKKMDDGMPGTGNVLSYTSALAATPNCASGTATTSTYKTTVSGNQCSLIFITGF